MLFVILEVGRLTFETLSDERVGNKNRSKSRDAKIELSITLL